MFIVCENFVQQKIEWDFESSLYLILSVYWDILLLIVQCTPYYMKIYGYCIFEVERKITFASHHYVHIVQFTFLFREGKMNELMWVRVKSKSIELPAINVQIDLYHLWHSLNFDLSERASERTNKRMIYKIM